MVDDLVDVEEVGTVAHAVVRGTGFGDNLLELPDVETGAVGPVLLGRCNGD